MGHGQCFPRPLNPFETMERKRELIKFFQVASENEIITRYPCFGESLAHNIIVKRRMAPLRRLRDLWDLEAVRSQLLSDYSVVVDDTIQPVAEINEIPRRPPLLDSPGYRSPPPPPQLPPADHTVLELFSVLNGTGLIDRWKEYLLDDRNFSVSDWLPSTTYRLATWNLDRFSVSKAKHPGVLEAICVTILSHQFDLIALQEVVEPKAVQLIVDELNSPKLPMTRRWMALNQVKSGNFAGFSSTEKTGRTFQAAEYSSFIYRSDRLKAISSRILEIEDNSQRPFSRLPFMSKFKIGSNTLILTSIHLKAPTLRESKSVKSGEEIKCLTKFIDAMKETFSDNIYYIILGDFNLDPGDQAFDAFRSRDLTSALPTYCATMASSVERGAGVSWHKGAQSRGTPCLDNAWLCRSLTTSSNSPVRESLNDSSRPLPSTSKSCPSKGLRFTGLSAVAAPVRHPLIPSTDYSDVCGKPSDHCPVYLDLEVCPSS
ncbi:hypothetical protein Aperf_G00000132424 [Anoplocephala perfoliata]